ncbi:hypothetical protein [Lysobacter gummosus]|uniref:hypothetical protein n=1 Tax=Lysobacter gummosus TaxID=262324 RepID=UPI0036393D7F
MTRQCAAVHRSSKGPGKPVSLGELRPARRGHLSALVAGRPAPSRHRPGPAQSLSHTDTNRDRGRDPRSSILARHDHRLRNPIRCPVFAVGCAGRSTRSSAWPCWAPSRSAPCIT